MALSSRLQLLDPAYAQRVYPVLPQPFVEQAPGFFAYLSQERGLKETATAQYLHYLRRFERYLVRIGLQDPRDLSAPVISAFITDSSTKLGVRSCPGGMICLHPRKRRRRSPLPRPI